MEFEFWLSKAIFVIFLTLGLIDLPTSRETATDYIDKACSVGDVAGSNLNHVFIHSDCPNGASRFVVILFRPILLKQRF